MGVLVLRGERILEPRRRAWLLNGQQDALGSTVIDQSYEGLS
jgi:hypothetical protein